jgi:uncharacterized protein (DUF2236 family)
MKNSLIILGLFFTSSALLLAVGCGGGDGGASGEQASAGAGSTDETGSIETTVTTSPRSKSEFLQLANGICKRILANRTTEVLQYAQEHRKPGVSEEELGAEAYRAVVIPKFPTMIEELRALGAPKGDEQRIEAFLASLVRMVNAPERLLLRELNRAGKLARAYGIGRCIY